MTGNGAFTSRLAIAHLSHGRRLLAVMLVAVLACSLTGSLRPALDRVEQRAEWIAHRTYAKPRLWWATVSFSILYAPSRTVRPGSGFSGATSQPDAVGNPASLGYSCKAIAAWDAVPYAAFSGTINLAVVAFHIAGIDYVKFIVAGGSAVNVRTTARNPATDVVEYVAVVNASDCTAGPVEVRAIVYPVVGVPRVLESMYIVAQPTGSGEWYPVYAYVSSGGNDGTGVASPTWGTAKAAPFASIGKAADAIKSYRNSNFSRNNVDGGIIRLSPEVHSWAAGGSVLEKTASNGWLFIEPEPDHSATDTTIRDGDSGAILCEKLCVRKLRLEQTVGANSGFIENTSGFLANTPLLWMDRNTIVGAGQWLAGSGVTGSNWSGISFTRNDISNVDFGTPSASFSSGNTIRDIGNDAHQNVAVVIGSRIDGMDAGVTGWHNDVWQHFNGNAVNHLDDNVIVYDVTATNLTFSADSHTVFIRPDVSGGDPGVAQGMAFVDITISGDGSNLPWMWYRSVDHLIWQNVDLSAAGEVIFEQEPTFAPAIAQITNFLCTGCDFWRVQCPNTWSDGVDFTYWDTNRFRLGAVAAEIPLNTYTAATGTLTSSVWFNISGSDPVALGWRAWIKSGTSAPSSATPVSGVTSAPISAITSNTGVCGTNAFGASNSAAGNWVAEVGVYPGADTDTRVKGTNATVG
jgi:hypothetical protein